MISAARPLKILVPVILALAIVATAEPVLAQGGGQERVEEYVQKTEELILWARDLVAETESSPARQVLKGAADLHQRSRRSMDDKRYAQAFEISRRARTAAYHSVRLAREAMSLEERIRIRSDHLVEEHRQLMDRARELGYKPAADLLDRARQKADRAREQYRQGDFKMAWKMLEQAGNLNRRAARMLADIGGPERLENELEMTAERIARVREALEPNAEPRALDLLAQADETLGKARRARDEGQPGRALRQAGLARQLADRAGQVAGGGPDAEAVRVQIERFDDRFARVADQVREAGSENARGLLDQAQMHRDRAERHLADGEPEEALRRIRAGHDLLGQAEDMIRH